MELRPVLPCLPRSGKTEMTLEDSIAVSKKNARAGSASTDGWPFRTLGYRASACVIDSLTQCLCAAKGLTCW